MNKEERMKKVWIGIAAALIVLAVGAGAFWAGVSYGKSQANQDLASLMQEQFGGRGGQHPGGMMTRQTERGDAMRFGGGIMGTVEAIEGGTLVINSDEGIVKVQTTDTTLIEKNMPVGVGDLEAGEMVVVSGPRNEDGSVTARSILSLRAFRLGQQSGGE
jgi:hypothetical protein